VRAGDLFVALRGESFDGHAFVGDAMAAGAVAAMVEDAGCAAPHVRVEHSLRALGAFASTVLTDRGIDVVGITGSCGKTTAKELTAAVLRSTYATGATPGNFNNEIGVPLSVFQLPDPCEVAVFELAMNAPGEIDRLSRMVRPRVGVITCVAPVHVEGVGSIEGVRDAKAELLNGIREDGTLVLNADDPTTAVIRKRFAGQVVTFGFGADADVRATDVGFDAEHHSHFTVAGSHRVRLRIYGQAAVTNALIAWTVGETFAIPAAKMIHALGAVEPMAMRMNLQTCGGITILNDAYNANPRSMAVAIDALVDGEFTGRTIAVLGDMLELGTIAQSEHRTLGGHLAAAGVDLAYLVGDWADEVREGALGGGMQPECIYVLPSTDDVVSSLRYILKPGDAVLVKGSRGMRMERVAHGLAEVL